MHTDRVAPLVGLGFATAFLAAAVMGFVPNPVVGDGGLFHTNLAHDLVHLATAVAFLAFAFLGAHPSVRFMRGFGLVYLAVGVAGFAVTGTGGEGHLLGVVHINALDNWLHLGLGASILLAGVLLGRPLPMRRIARATAALVATTLLTAGAVHAAGTAESTVGVGGYDLVSYHTGKKPLRGNGNHVAVHDGVTYLFISDANKATFEAAPARYLPAYGGWCAYGVAVGKKFVGDPDVWRIEDGRLYLNLDSGIQEKWLQDVDGYVDDADAKWPRIEDRLPSEL